MRFDLHKVRTYLVNELQAAPPIARVEHDGTDIILAELATGESVIVHLVERLSSINEVKQILDENTAARRHTLFVLWADMLLPPENRPCIPEDWMEVLFTLYGGLIYGYDSYGPYASVFPVTFEKLTSGYQRFVRYGEAIRAAHLHCDYVHLNTQHLRGYWHIASFAERRSAPSSTGTNQTEDGQPRGRLSPERNSMTAYYDLLNIALSSDREAVRAAYRQLARQHHPDLSDAPDATQRMQEINEAYERIMRQFEDD